MAKRCDNCKPDLCLFAGGGSGGGGGSSTLSGLTDVDISNPTNGQTLVYNATSGKWENGAGGGGSGGAMLVLHVTGQTGALDKTAKEILDAINAGKSIVQEVVTEGGMFHTYSLFVSYYASPDEGYEFDFVEFSPSGVVTYSAFVTFTENGYPAFAPPPP